MFWLSCLSVLSWMPCPSCNVFAVMFSLSCYRAPAVLCWLSCSGCPVLAVLFWLSCAGCPVLAVLCWLSCPATLILSQMSCPCCHVMAIILSSLSCPSWLDPVDLSGRLVQTDLFLLSCPIFSVLAVKPSLSCQVYKVYILSWLSCPIKHKSEVSMKSLWLGFRENLLFSWKGKRLFFLSKKARQTKKFFP